MSIVTESTRTQLYSGFPEPVFARPKMREFDGKHSDTLSVSHRDALEIDTGSIAFEFNADKVTGRQGLMSKDAELFAGGGNNFSAWLQGDVLKFRFKDDDSAVQFQLKNIKADQDYKVLATFDEDNVKFYVNGNLHGKKAFSIDLTKNDQFLQIGALGWSAKDGANTPTDPFDGTMSDVFIFDQVLRPQDLITPTVTLSARAGILQHGTVGPQEWGAGVFLSAYGLNGELAEVRYSEEFEDHGFGVAAPGSRWEGQIDFYSKPSRASEKLVIDFGGDVTDVTVSVGMLGATEGTKVKGVPTPETGAWKALDASGAVVDTGLIGPAQSTGKIDGTYGVYPIEIDTDGVAFASLEITATQFGHGAGKSKTASYGENSSDFNLMEVEFTRVDDDALL